MVINHTSPKTRHTGHRSHRLEEGKVTKKQLQSFRDRDNVMELDACIIQEEIKRTDAKIERLDLDFPLEDLCRPSKKRKKLYKYMTQ